MAPPSKSTEWDAESPEAKRLLAEDSYEDCLSCKVMGKSLIRPATPSGNL
jgi:hypothetical protein